MVKTVLYEYLGTNGTITSPVHLEDIYYVRVIKLTAAPHKILTNGIEQKKVITIPEEELDQWQEVNFPIEE